ncbi:MAG: hypothetical protein U0841_00970 [Chloroflexia bacterium]
MRRRLQSTYSYDTGGDKRVLDGLAGRVVSQCILPLSTPATM